ncbi:aminopeptidase n [Lasius niger]|uniref:Aminopeptidase n n=1 Tax=Lasius niger TaxID=67767 RepID=A0A0J7KEM9_LASNI|nr:aminopeptidase n [Lasius niger]
MPEFRITFDISIMHNRRYNALSNMPVRESNPAKVFKDMVWTYFQKTSLISIDNVALIVFDLNQTINLAETTNIWCRPQLIPYVKFELFIIENVTMYLDIYWNNSKRVLERTLLSSEWKVDHVAMPDFQGEVKQTLGFVFYR